MHNMHHKDRGKPFHSHTHAHLRWEQCVCVCMCVRRKNQKGTRYNVQIIEDSNITSGENISQQKKTKKIVSYVKITKNILLTFRVIKYLIILSKILFKLFLQIIMYLAIFFGFKNQININNLCLDSFKSVNREKIVDRQTRSYRVVTFINF